MLNIPGTLLIVRRRERGTGAPGSVRGTFDRQHVDINGPRGWDTSCEIPYGEICIMTNYTVKGQPSIHTRQQIYELELLWRGKKVVVTASDRKVNTWFTHPNTWKARGHDKNLDGFHADGSMDRLYGYTRNTDLIRGTT